VPRAIELMPIDVKTGKRAIFGEEGVILEAFKPGDEPPESTKVIGESMAAASQSGVQLQPARPAPPPPVAQPQQPDGLTGDAGGLY
jgi:penicillin-binding protein 1A